MNKSKFLLIFTLIGILSLPTIFNSVNYSISSESNANTKSPLLANNIANIDTLLNKNKLTNLITNNNTNIDDIAYNLHLDNPSYISANLDNKDYAFSSIFLKNNSSVFLSRLTPDEFDKENSGEVKEIKQNINLDNNQGQELLNVLNNNTNASKDESNWQNTLKTSLTQFNIRKNTKLEGEQSYSLSFNSPIKSNYFLFTMDTSCTQWDTPLHNTSLPSININITQDDSSIYKTSSSINNIARRTISDGSSVNTFLIPLNKMCDIKKIQISFDKSLGLVISQFSPTKTQTLPNYVSTTSKIGNIGLFSIPQPNTLPRFLNTSSTIPVIQKSHVLKFIIIGSSIILGILFVWLITFGAYGYYSRNKKNKFDTIFNS